MLATSGAFASAVAGVDYYAAWRVQITLPAAATAYQDVTLAVSSVQVTASTTTDMPEGSRLEVGYPAIGCDFTVSGLVDPTDAAKTAGWLFGPYSSSSPLYRSDVLYAAVTVDFGVYTATSAGSPEWVRKFTGVVDDYSVSQDGSVAFSCVDAMRAKLRSVPGLPAVITAPPYNAGLTSEYAVDALLRKATGGKVSSWPPIRPSCILAAGMRASLWPEVGSLLTTSGQQPQPAFRSGVMGSALAAATVQFGGLSKVTYNAAAPAGTSVFVEFWTSGTFLPTSVEFNNAGSLALGIPLISCTVNNTGLFVTPGPQLGGPTFSWSTTVTSDAHYIAFELTLPAAGGTAWSAVSHLDAASSSSGALAFTTPRDSSSWSLIVVNPTNGTIEGLQVTNAAPGALNNAFFPAALLNPSLNNLTVVPEIEAGDPFTVIQQIADAELAHAGGDESGIFRFYNRNTIRGAASQRDVTSAASLTAIGNAEVAAAGVINRATVEYTPWSFATANTTVWSATAAIRVPKGSTKTLTVTSDGPFASVARSFTKLADGSTDVTGSHYRASTDQYGMSEHPGLTITAIQTSPTTADLTMINNATQDAWLVSPSNYLDYLLYPVGTPVLQLAGLVVSRGDALTQDVQYPPAANGGAASSRFGEQATQISGNPWLQDDGTAFQLASDIVVDQVNPRPNLTGVEIVPDPRIQLIDVVHLVDPDRTGIDEYVRVFGWTITWEAASDATSPMRYDMTIDARTLAAPGGWIMGYAGRSEVGSTAYVYASS